MQITVKAQYTYNSADDIGLLFWGIFFRIMHARTIHFSAHQCLNRGYEERLFAWILPLLLPPSSLHDFAHAPDERNPTSINAITVLLVDIVYGLFMSTQERSGHSISLAR